MAVAIKVLGPSDEAVLARVADEVFDGPVDPALAREFLDDARHHIAVAIDDGLVVGFASGLHYVHPDKPAELFVNEVAVSPSHRRRGLGKAVLAALLECAAALGCASAWVLTDRDNAAANALYAALGGVFGTEGLGEELRGFTFEINHQRADNGA
ncbi:MAG TPA: GNAT family N-acetyltransferase [Caulobacteraceae bacterium]